MTDGDNAAATWRARATIVASALFLVWWTWNHWGDVQVDCGRELYIPIQIAHGKLLYRDVWYQYGPLEPYLAGLLVVLFGPYLYVFYSFGFVIALGAALMLYDIGKVINEREIGLAAALVLLLQGFGFSSFNYIFPYSYAASLGLMLSLLCAYLTIRQVVGNGLLKLSGAGLAAGLALLCKQEFGFACYLLLSFVCVTDAIHRRSARSLLSGITACVPGVVINVAVYGWFLWKLTPGFILDSWFGPGGAYVATAGAHLYARAGMRFSLFGLLALAAEGSAGLLLWFGIAKASRSPRVRLRWPLVAIALVAIARRLSHHSAFVKRALNGAEGLFIFPSSLFVLGCAFVAYSLYRLRKDWQPRILAEAALGVFALGCGWRTLAQTAPEAYGIFYSAPFFLLFALMLVQCARVAAHELSPDQQRVLVNTLLAAEVAMLGIMLVPVSYLSPRTAKLETRLGSIYLNPGDASTARKIINFISKQKQHGRRVAVLPEAAMMYAFTDTEAPSRWYTILPGFVQLSQEEEYIAALKRTHCDYVLLTNRNTAEYGAPYFGINYDQTLYRWIEQNYKLAGQFGDFRRDGTIGAVLAALVYQRDNLIPIRPRT